MRQKQKTRLKELRGKQNLSNAENAELSELLAQADAEETALLAPSWAKMERETAEITRQNAALRSLVERRKALAARLRRQLGEAQAESRAINAERDRVLAASSQ